MKRTPIMAALALGFALSTAHATDMKNDSVSGRPTGEAAMTKGATKDPMPHGSTATSGTSTHGSSSMTSGTTGSAATSGTSPAAAGMGGNVSGRPTGEAAMTKGAAKDPARTDTTGTRSSAAPSQYGTATGQAPAPAMAGQGGSVSGRPAGEAAYTKGAGKEPMKAQGSGSDRVAAPSQYGKEGKDGASTPTAAGSGMAAGQGGNVSGRPSGEAAFTKGSAKDPARTEGTGSNRGAATSTYGKDANK